MTYSNMKTPPPVVTGIVLPSDLSLNKKNNYQQIKDRKQQAIDELNLSRKKSASKEERKVPFIGKLLGIAGIATILTILFKKGKLPFKPKTPKA